MGGSSAATSFDVNLHLFYCVLGLPLESICNMPLIDDHADVSSKTECRNFGLRLYNVTSSLLCVCELQIYVFIFGYTIFKEST